MVIYLQSIKKYSFYNFYIKCVKKVKSYLFFKWHRKQKAKPLLTISKPLYICVCACEKTPLNIQTKCMCENGSIFRCCHVGGTRLGVQLRCNWLQAIQYTSYYMYYTV